ncbi:MAG: hypothetical protein OXN97_06715 [Bryobacterales bacterium]|nr:hypothetical protein [Bryobacterales bacterium]MDE3262365.1 hypothetical protein [Acidobacteriota bacterium]
MTTQTVGTLAIILIGVGLLIVSVKVRRIADLVKRLALAFSALDFKRAYGIGGVALFILMLESAPDPLPLDPGGWLIVLAALSIPVVATVVSEAAFVLVQSLTKSEPVPFDFVPARIEETVEKSRVRRNVGSAHVTDEGETNRSTSRVLMPVDVPPGGFKQIIRCFFSQSFSSSFWGYSPYSGFVGPVKSDSLADGHRVTVLAKAADAADFEHLEYRAFQMKRVTDLCWILVRDPVTPAVARAAIQAQREVRDAAGPKDVKRPDGWY